MADADRYDRQRRLDVFGADGQRRLAEGRALIVGCGALGSSLASLLARAGVGHLRIVDRDLLETSNLHRQVLYGEQDVADGTPKAVAAARRLHAINSEVSIDEQVADVDARNIGSLIEGVDLVLDGTDNFETRYLINDACVERGLPWVYGGVVGTIGMTLTVIPGEGPCLRCVFPEPPPPGSLPTCDTVGVLNTAPALVAALQATEAIKLWIDPGAVDRKLRHVDLWDGSIRALTIERSPDCPACVDHRYDFLAERASSWTTTLCGRNAVQITPPADAPAADLQRLRSRLEAVGSVRDNGLLIQADVDDHSLLLFPDGRVIVEGTTDPALARSLVARYVGS